MRNTFAVLVNNKSIKDEEVYWLGGLLNAANIDSGIICHFNGPVTEVDLDKGGNIDVIIDAKNYPKIAVAKAKADKMSFLTHGSLI